MESWHQMLLETLEELSDPEAQRLAWTTQAPATFPSPVEIINQLFDDTGLDDLLEAGPLLSAETDDELRELSKLATSVNLDQAPDALLRDSGWRALQTLAAQALIRVKRDLSRSPA